MKKKKKLENRCLKWDNPYVSTSYLTASFLRRRSHAKIPFFSSSSKLDLSIFSGDSRSILRFLHHLSLVSALENFSREHDGCDYVENMMVVIV